MSERRGSKCDNVAAALAVKEPQQHPEKPLAVRDQDDSHGTPPTNVHFAFRANQASRLARAWVSLASISEGLP